MAVNAKPRREYAGHQEEYQKQDVEHGKHPLHPGNPGSQLRCCLPIHHAFITVRCPTTDSEPTFKKPKL